jgi:hypothetical protein
MKIKYKTQSLLTQLGSKGKFSGDDSKDWESTIIEK